MGAALGLDRAAEAHKFQRGDVMSQRSIVLAAMPDVLEWIQSSPDGVTVSELSSRHGWSLRTGSMCLYMLSQRGLIASTHCGSHVCRWTTVDRVQALREQIDAATAERLRMKQIVKNEKRRCVQRDECVSIDAADDDDTMDDVDREPFVHVWRQSAEAPPPDVKGPASVFHLAGSAP